ncbi:unnamed protein product [marine sediment metagenome]|uniref:30S ribosomal protein S6 n=1 Tax=marine sediment metagenome TaxID=412755 RepID=X0UZ42_9ZZZZ
MFLFDPSVASQWETAENEVGRILERASAEVIGVKKWDERRLAYEIQHRKRACYALTRFRASGSNIGGIERDARLSEMILRLLVVQCDLSEEKLAEFGKEAAEQSAFLHNAAEEARKAAEAKAEEAAERTAERPVEPVSETTSTPVDGGEASGVGDDVTKIKAPPAEAAAEPEDQDRAPEPAASSEAAGEPDGDEKPQA